MNSYLKHTTFILLLGFLFVQTSLFAQFEIPDKPTSTKAQKGVYDYFELLSDSQKRLLENKLIKYSDTTSTQIVIAIIGSTKGEEIGYLATNWAHKWGIGQAKEDNGVFILLAQNDRKITIRTGYGTEHLLTDYVSRQIIEYNILPYFKKGNYYAGLNSGVNSIFKVMNGEYKGTRKEKTSEFNPGIIIFIVILIIFFMVVFRGNKGNRGGRSYRRRDGARDLFETIILSNSGRGGFGGGSFGGSGGFGGSSGGGFGGGFGGGGFGGGGATGGW